MSPPPIEQVTIIGTGLLGGSVGLALRQGRLAQRVIGTGSRLTTLERAVALGCVDHVTTDLAESVHGSDLILLAAPVGKIPVLLEQLAPLVRDGAILTDVGSTKATIVQAAERFLKHPEQFVGSHPMAGGETTGPESARADLFRDKPVILTPTPRTSPQALERVESLWQGLGMVPHRMSPAEHDRLVAVISHVPHAAAVLLVELATRSGALPVASSGFADTTRLAMGDPQLWADIFLDNRRAVIEAMDEWATRASDFRRMLDSSDRPALLQWLTAAQASRRDWRDRPKGKA